MKFLYAYNDSANERRSGELSASSRDEAFKILRAQKIRPIYVELAPGVLNRILSLGKRGLAIVVLSIVAVAAFLLAMSRGREVRDANDVFDATSRRYPIGDQVLIEDGIRTGWASVFAEEGDRFLASFVVPGVSAGVKTSTIDAVGRSLERDVVRHEKDGIEARQIKAMVRGVKAELRAFIDAGGSIKQYCSLLVERQDSEIAMYNRAMNELKELKRLGVSQEELYTKWAKLNRELKNVGIRSVPRPE